MAAFKDKMLQFLVFCMWSEHGFRIPVAIIEKVLVYSADTLFISFLSLYTVRLQFNQFNALINTTLALPRR